MRFLILLLVIVSLAIGCDSGILVTGLPEEPEVPEQVEFTFENECGIVYLTITMTDPDSLYMSFEDTLSDSVYTQVFEIDPGVKTINWKVVTPRAPVKGKILVHGNSHPKDKIKINCSRQGK